MKQREHWGSSIGFIMATAGSAIGLGSLWKFPYVTGVNGGGIFVLIYIMFTLVIGLPIFIGELIVGRNTGRGPISALGRLSQDSAIWKLVGWMLVLTPFLIFSYYNVVAGWTLNYTLLSLTQFAEGRTPEEIREVFEVMRTSADVNIFFHFLFMLLNGGIVYLGIRKGIEYWSKLLTPALFMMLIGLVLYSCTLEGFDEALAFIFAPDWSRLRPSGVIEALGLSFFTLSAGLGILITYGSYMRKESDLPGTALMIGGMGLTMSMLSAVMIFPIIFTFNMEPQMGPGLAFQALPVLFAKLPGNLVISTAFFILLVFTTLTSTISLLEVLVASLMEVTGWNRHKAVIYASSAVFIFGIPSALAASGAMFPTWEVMYGMNFFDTIAVITDRWMIPLGGMASALFVGWRCDPEMLRKEFCEGSKLAGFFGVWLWVLRWVVPVAIAIVIAHQSGLVDVDALAASFTREATL